MALVLRLSMPGEVAKNAGAVRNPEEAKRSPHARNHTANKRRNFILQPCDLVRKEAIDFGVVTTQRQTDFRTRVCARPTTTPFSLRGTLYAHCFNCKAGHHTSNGQLFYLELCK